MDSYTQAAVERAMKVQEVMLQAIAKKITWWQAAEILGIRDRQMRRWRERYEEFGFRGLAACLTAVGKALGETRADADRVVLLHQFKTGQSLPVLSLPLLAKYRPARD